METNSQQWLKIKERSEKKKLPKWDCFIAGKVQRLKATRRVTVNVKFGREMLLLHLHARYIHATTPKSSRTQWAH